MSVVSQMSNQVLQAIHERRSTVRFKSAEADMDKIQQILDAGRWAPSYLNRQPWDFIVVTDSEVKRQLGGIGVRVTLFSQGVQQASAVIVIVVDPKKDPEHYIEDGAVATQNMALAAYSLGLASYWLGIFDSKGEKHSPEESAKEILKIPKEFRVIALLPMGVPAYEEHSDRRRLNDFVHWNQYGRH